MNYRNISDLESCIVRNLWRLPADVDLIAGVPRSGMLAAAMLALHLNLPLTDIDSLAEGRLLQSGYRLSDDRLRTIASARRIAVVDDSVLTGREMRRARAKIEACGLGQKVVYVAVYGADEAVTEVDTYFEVCPMPRIFSWNLMHRSLLSSACVDIDGVLCVDPTEEENDDEPIPAISGNRPASVQAERGDRDDRHLPTGEVPGPHRTLACQALNPLSGVGDVGSAR